MPKWSKGHWITIENQTHEIAWPYPKFVPFVVYNHVGFAHFRCDSFRFIWYSIKCNKIVCNSQILNENEQKRSLEDLDHVICEQLAKIYCEDALPPICLNSIALSLFSRKIKFWESIKMFLVFLLYKRVDDIYNRIFLSYFVIHIGSITACRKSLILYPTIILYVCILTHTYEAYIL